jgi:uncharacterized repeat protein (TIGR04138 family)
MKDFLAFQLAVHEVCRKDSRFSPQAYGFLCEALEHTSKTLDRAEGDDRHVTGQELMQGWRDLAVQQFGPMAWFVMCEWGVLSSENVGAMVYNFIEIGYFRKNETDSIHDFSDGVDLEAALKKPFTPARLEPGAE